MNLNEGYWVNKCCKDSNWSKIMGDRENVMCMGCGKTTTLKFISEWKEEFEDKIILMEDECKEGIDGKHLGFEVNKNYGKLTILIKNSIGNKKKVKIKAKDGKIVIERIEE